MKKRPTEGNAVVTVRFADGRRTKRTVSGAVAHDIWDLVGREDAGPSVPWREVAKEHLVHGEPAMMVRAGRRRAGMTQKELAKQLGVSQAYVSDLEHGKRAIGVGMAKRLGDLLNFGYRVFL